MNLSGLLLFLLSSSNRGITKNIDENYGLNISIPIKVRTGNIARAAIEQSAYEAIVDCPSPMVVSSMAAPVTVLRQQVNWKELLAVTVPHGKLAMTADGLAQGIDALRKYNDTELKEAAERICEESQEALLVKAGADPGKRQARATIMKFLRLHSSISARISLKYFFDMEQKMAALLQFIYDVPTSEMTYWRPNHNNGFDLKERPMLIIPDGMGQAARPVFEKYRSYGRRRVAVTIASCRVTRKSPV